MLEDSMPVFTDFPPDDLLDALVDIYFRNVNDHLPLLHEPTFKKALEDGLHESNGDFGATVLLVCANGARYSADSRVLFGESEDRQSAGWKWFHQVQTARKLLFAPARLYDLQVYVVRVQFSRCDFSYLRANSHCSSWTYTCKTPRLLRERGRS